MRRAVPGNGKSRDIKEAIDLVFGSSRLVEQGGVLKLFAQPLKGRQRLVEAHRLQQDVRE